MVVVEWDVWCRQRGVWGLEGKSPTREESLTPEETLGKSSERTGEVRTEWSVHVSVVGIHG